MSQETTQTTDAALITPSEPEFKRDPSDGIIDVNDLPPIPWTREALGETLFNALAMAAGVGNLGDHQRNPSIDPRSFGFSRAKRLIRISNAKGPVAKAYFDEGARLQANIDQSLPAIKGRPRQAGAPPLTPATTIFREKGPKPSRWS